MKCSELLRQILKAGWYIDRQAKGSHVVLKHPDKSRKPILFPDHGSKEMAKGLKIKLKKQAGIK